MTTQPSALVNTVTVAYQRCSTSIVRLRIVPFPELHNLVKMGAESARPLDPINPTSLERAWQILRRTTWKVNTLVLPPSQIGLDAACTQLSELIPSIRLNGDEAGSAKVEAAIQILSEAATITRNPLGDEIIAAHTEQPEIVLLVESEPAVEVAKDFCRVNGLDIVVRTKSQVNWKAPCHNLLAIGSPKWFPTAMLTAPVADLTEYILFDWTKYTKRIPGLLPVESHGVEREMTVLGTLKPAIEIDLDDLPPSPNWGAIANAARTGSDEGTRDVMAKSALLSGNHGVLIPHDEESRMTVAIPGTKRLEISRVTARDVEPGMLLLFRTSHSDQDLIRQLADSRFGAEAHRETLEIWKSALRLKLLEQGPAAVERSLRAHGATTSNVRYWASPASIRPDSAHDFTILLKYLDLAAIGPSLMAAADEVRSAHRKAAHHVRTLLEEKLKDTNLDMIDGVMVIQLDGIDGGELAVHQLLDISSETFVTPETSLLIPTPLKGDSWLA